MIDPTERRRRWRLVLGETDTTGAPSAGINAAHLDQPLDRRIDQLLHEIYAGGAAGGHGQSSPRLLRWLGDLRHLFPDDVRRLVVKDAIGVIGLPKFVEDPQLRGEIESDPTLVRALLEITATLPAERREAARELIRQIVDSALDRLRLPVEQALRQHLNRVRPHRPRHLAEVDWNRTIRANLKHYQPDLQTIIPARLVGRPVRKSRRTIIICVDSSESMACSAFNAAVIATIIAAIPSFRTHLVSFDTRVADLTHLLSDPVEILFHLNLAGGTDIGKALDYCRTLTSYPAGTTIFLISDLRDRHPGSHLLASVADTLKDGIRIVPVVALDDLGEARYDSTFAARLAALGVNPIVTTPASFPELLLSTLEPTDPS